MGTTALTTNNNSSWHTPLLAPSPTTDNSSQSISSRWEANPPDLITTSRWAGLRVGFQPQVFGVKLILDIDAVSHEVQNGEDFMANQNNIQQGFTVGLSFRGNQFNLLAANRSTLGNNTENWSDFDIIFMESVGRGSVNASRGGDEESSIFTFGVGGGLFVGGEVEYDIGRFFNEQVFGSGNRVTTQEFYEGRNQ